MKLVIDIPEEKYDVIESDLYSTFPSEMKEWGLKAIRNGTPLPKGHGRLIDADAFQKYCFKKNFDERLSEEGLAIINMFLAFQSTIMEADKSESEDK